MPTWLATWIIISLLARVMIGEGIMQHLSSNMPETKLGRIILIILIIPVIGDIAIPFLILSFGVKWILEGK